MERLGIVGLPDSGKSSLFNALTGASALVAAHPFSATEPPAVGSGAEAEEAGKLRVGGKDYEAVDGDVLEIRSDV